MHRSEMFEPATEVPVLRTPTAAPYRYAGRIRSAVVVGTGLIGTSVALCLAGHGVQVHLRDADDDSGRTASALGAGRLDPPAEPADLAVVAVPPALVGQVFAEVQQEGLARHCMDVASVKRGPLRDAEALGCDLSSCIGSHPMAGRELSGPLAAQAALFKGRPWVLTPTERTGTETLNLALELIALCGAVPVLMDAAEHDRAVALVSHTPQLVASLMAARLETAEPSTVRLAGQGLRDVVRTAASAPAMWMDILDANAGVVADVLDDLAADLTATVRALRDLSAPPGTGRAAGAGRLADLLRRGNAGHGRIPGKHGEAATRYDSVAVLIGDQPGELARLLADVGATGVNVEDVKIEHSPRDASGLVELSVTSGTTPGLAAALQARGWGVRLADAASPIP